MKRSQASIEKQRSLVCVNGLNAANIEVNYWPKEPREDPQSKQTARNAMQMVQYNSKG